MGLLAKHIPPVSREFALELKARFKPMAIRPGVDKDALMFNAGQLDVIRFVLETSNNSTLKSSVEIDSPGEKNPTDVSVSDSISIEDRNDTSSDTKKKWYHRFSTRHYV